MTTLDIKILGPGCANCKALETATRQALTELGLDAQIDKVTDFADIAAYGVMSTPGLVVDGTVVAAGRVPNAKQIADLLDARATSPSDRGATEAQG
jgi:small redox-active disulfide protein 2